MFGKKPAKGHTDTLIADATEINGDVHISGVLHLDGIIRGNVTSSGEQFSMLTISEQGRVEGSIHVPQIIINGTVVGDVHASDRVELHSNARVVGDVYYAVLEMTAGAEVNGQMVHCDDINQHEMIENKAKKSGANKEVAEEATESYIRSLTAAGEG